MYFFRAWNTKKHIHNDVLTVAILLLDIDKIAPTKGKVFLRWSIVILLINKNYGEIKTRLKTFLCVWSKNGICHKHKDL